MAPTIPSSLSPHVCILAAPELEDLLESASLPPLHTILQSFSPLPQVTTRTTTLASVPHSSFALRFSDILDVEQACREDEDQRAVRTVDWISARINSKCAKWVQDAEKVVDRGSVRTPWWDELRRCTEGDFVPSKTEGWNHPVAIIYAVSTTAPNPLAAISTLHSRTPQLPAWVDPNFLKYTLIVHPQHSPLSDEEAGALFNAVKRQYGSDTYLLNLRLPKPSPPPITVPAVLPRLPPPPLPDSPPSKMKSPTMSEDPNHQTVVNSLRLEEGDIQQLAKFVREFVVMSLIIWMEKCVTDWNEAFTSTRRLPSRLFSSTRRLFGSPSPSPAPSGHPARSSTLPAAVEGGPTPPSQIRRLAEFTTILGDFKLAVSVWEALRKESKGGSDILPLLLAPSPAIPLHVSTALANLHSTSYDIPPHAQVRALLYAVRWEASVSHADFISSVMEGERWLIWAAGIAEEVPSALLLGHAALLSARKGANRRAALLYVSAASRLEKCGLKPLTMYFYRKALEHVSTKPHKELSPSFWASEGKSALTQEGLEDILSGLEHSLGRLLYTSGDLHQAVDFLLRLLRGPSLFSANSAIHAEPNNRPPSNDKVYLEDLRVAYSYWSSSNPAQASKAAFKLPVSFVVSKKCSVRYLGSNQDEDADVWSSREDNWKAFLKAQGEKTPLVANGKVSVNELFWVDVTFQNPLDAEVSLSDITLVVDGPSPEEVEIEVVKELLLAPKQTVQVPISLRSKTAGKVKVTQAKYNMLSLFPNSESLACRGRRLHDTPQQRQSRVYAPDIYLQADVVPSDHRLSISQVDDQRAVLLQGETRHVRLWLTNTGSKPISDVWLVAGDEESLWFGPVPAEGQGKAGPSMEVVESTNSMKPAGPQKLVWEDFEENPVIQPGGGAEVSVLMHIEETGERNLQWLFAFREDDSQPFYSSRMLWTCTVQPLLQWSATADPSQTTDQAYTIQLDVTNVSTAAIELTQITSIGAQWSLVSGTRKPGILLSSQCSRMVLGASPSTSSRGSIETIDFVSKKLAGILQAKPVEASPPSIELQCSHLEESPIHSTLDPALFNSIESSRRTFVSRLLASNHSYIPADLHAQIFPLYNPSSLDIILFWRHTASQRRGHLSVHGISLGARHAFLSNIVEEAENAKIKRSMYAETQRENTEVLNSIRESDWNAEMDPLFVAVQGTRFVTHDFDAGPCSVPVQFMVRNYSTTHSVTYTLRLKGKALTSPNLLPPPYSGRLTFRGALEPTGEAILEAKMWANQAGAYGLDSWVAETELCPREADTQTAVDRVGRRRYRQEATVGKQGPTCVFVSDRRV